MKAKTIWVGALLLTMLSTATAVGQPEIPSPDDSENPPSFMVMHDWDSGFFDGNGESTVLAATTMIGQPGASWIRLHFGGSSLGSESFVRIRCVAEPEAVQDLYTSSMENWYDFSAFFRGEAVLVELHVAPSDAAVFVKIDSFLVGNAQYVSPWEPPPVQGPDSLCGNDNRVASNDARVGRIVRANGARICSPWLASNGAAVMAGHCFDNDNNGTNELIAAGSLMEFNPPASSGAGVPNPSLPQDQYPIDMTTLNWAPVGWQLGSDWGVFGLNPNANNLDRAHVTRGFFRTTREAPGTGTGTIRITGCGTDSTPAGTGGGNNAQNRTLQTDAGPYVQESNNGARFWHQYQADTTAGNSGGPILWANQNVVIGIHTNAGCGNDGAGGTTGANQGISFEHNPLETALRNFVSVSAIFVDRGMPNLGVAEDGTVFRPFDTVAEGVAATPAVLSIVEGTYNEPQTITSAMLLEAPAGTVVIN